jgi:hypothetical protein
MGHLKKNCTSVYKTHSTAYKAKVTAPQSEPPTSTELSIPPETSAPGKQTMQHPKFFQDFQDIKPPIIEVFYNPHENLTAETRYLEHTGLIVFLNGTPRPKLMSLIARKIAKSIIKMRSSPNQTVHVPFGYDMIW